MKFLSIVAITFLALSACKKQKIEDPVITPPNENEEEVITTFKIYLSDTNGVAFDTIVFRDIDGVGGNGPSSFDTILLSPSSFYNARLELLNESANPVDNITTEIEEEAHDHLFCFDPSINGALQVEITDMDNQGLPLGLLSRWAAGTVNSGTLNIRLKHQPGIKTGDCSLGETDVELTFQVKIQ